MPQIAYTAVGVPFPFVATGLGTAATTVRVGDTAIAIPWHGAAAGTIPAGTVARTVGGVATVDTTADLYLVVATVGSAALTLVKLADALTNGMDATLGGTPQWGILAEATPNRVREHQQGGDQGMGAFGPHGGIVGWDHNDALVGTRHYGSFNDNADLIWTATDDAGGDTVDYSVDLSPVIKAQIAASAALATVTTKFASAAGTGRVLGIGSGSPPAGWQNPAFADGGWGFAVAESSSFWPLAGAAPVTWQDGVVTRNERWLFRFSFTVPAGVVSSWDISLLADQHAADVYMNGTLLFADPSTTDLGSIPAPTHLEPALGLLVADGVTENVLAIMVRHAARVSPPIASSMSYIMFVLTVPAVGGLPLLSGTEGDMLYYTGGAWAKLPVGAAGTVIASNGADPGYAAPIAVAHNGAAVGSGTSVNLVDSAHITWAVSIASGVISITPTYVP